MHTDFRNEYPEISEIASEPPKSLSARGTKVRKTETGRPHGRREARLALAELGLIDEYEFVVSGAPFSGLV